MFANLLQGFHFAAQTGGGLEQAIDNAVRPVTDFVSSIIFFSVRAFGADWPLVVLWLVAGGVFFTVYLGFLPLRAGKLALRVVRGRFSSKNDPGEITHFEALCSAVSGTVGVSNIAGVAIAIALGGPGAAFWMTVAGILGMSTKMAECTLGVKYRREQDGVFSGGPMPYLERGLKKRGWARLGRGMAIFYAVGIMIGCLGIGNMFQANQAFVQFVSVTGGADGWFADKGWLVGLVIAGLTGAVIIGGIRSIAAVASRLVPLMALVYFFCAATVVALNAAVLPEAIQTIVAGAFTAEGMAGGAVGAMVIGFQRAVFSNEAGIGSASIAHSAVKTRYPATEGLVAMFEPFLDTIVICNLTALVIVTTQLSAPGLLDGIAGGIEMTSASMARQVAAFPYLLAVAAALFAFSTLITWSYYGLKGWTYLVGESRRADTIYKLGYCFCAAMGCMIKVDAILDFSDAMVFIICIPNLAGLYIMAPVVKGELRRFLAHVKDTAPEHLPRGMGVSSAAADDEPDG